MTKVFISYARRDSESARRLYDALSVEPALDVWFDQVRLLPGVRWKPAIRKAIRESRYFLALLSRQSSSTQGYRHSELKQAIEIMEEFPEDLVFVIPVRIEQCEPPVDVLRELSYSDLFPNFASGVANLKRTLLVPPVKAAQVVNPQWWYASIQKGKRKSSGPISVAGSSEYHYQARLVALDIAANELREVAVGLNAIQQFAFFQVSQIKPSRAAIQQVDGLPQLNVSDLSKQFYAKISPLEVDRVICMTKHLLMIEEDGMVYYNYLGVASPVNERVAFRSISGLREFAEEAGISYQAAIAYELVSDITSYFLNADYHAATRGCPLDFTEDHRNSILGLRRGAFCKPCLRKLDTIPHLRDAMTVMLEWGR